MNNNYSYICISITILYDTYILLLKDLLIYILTLYHDIT